MYQSEEIRAWAKTKWRRKLVRNDFYHLGEPYAIDMEMGTLDWEPEKELHHYELMVYEIELQMRLDDPNFIR